MNEQEQIKQFNADIDNLITDGEILPHTNRSQDDYPLLALAEVLVETDLSGESQQVAAIRQHLINVAINLKTMHPTLSHSQPIGIKTMTMNKTLRILAVSAAAFIILTIAILTIPPLHAIAQEIINFFIPATSDISNVELHVGGPDPSPLDDRYPLSLEALTEQVEFEILLPTFMPQPYTFDGASYDPERQSVFLNYRCAGPWAIGISQHRTTENVDNFYRNEVGASAEIEQVTIGTAIGQYVRGAWIVEVDPNVRQQADEIGTAITVMTESVWTNDSQWQRLDWYTDSTLYSILTSGGLMENTENNYQVCLLEKEDFVEIARGLQPASSG
ncbi:MAG: hypothetical protein H7Y09_06930 [Chitinophagaceae bacterium]|nr:hypothetical protein [Anaerolineae bacterium]